LEEDEPKVEVSQLILFVRQWLPEKFEFGKGEGRGRHGSPSCPPPLPPAAVAS
jgi:hypothetical protein